MFFADPETPLPKTKRYGIFHSPATVELLNARARRVHIGTHGGRDLNRALDQIFAENGWRQVWNFEKGVQTTKWGPVEFGDGILSFVNENPGLACKWRTGRRRKRSGSILEIADS